MVFQGHSCPFYYGLLGKGRKKDFFSRSLRCTSLRGHYTLQLRNPPLQVKSTRDETKICNEDIFSGKEILARTRGMRSIRGQWTLRPLSSGFSVNCSVIPAYLLAVRYCSRYLQSRVTDTEPFEHKARLTHGWPSSISGIPSQDRILHSAGTLNHRTYCARCRS
jgi:hypothetical protein